MRKAFANELWDMCEVLPIALKPGDAYHKLLLISQVHLFSEGFNPLYNFFGVDLNDLRTLKIKIGVDEPGRPRRRIASYYRPAVAGRLPNSSILARIEFKPYEQYKLTTREFIIRWAAPPKLHLKSSKQ
jgi:hypothetical protein